MTSVMLDQISHTKIVLIYTFVPATEFRGKENND